MSQQILTSLQYRSFDSLLEDVRVDLKGYALSGRIEPQQLIKVAQRVSYDLGLRINQTKEAVIQIDNSKGRLPDDFYVMNFALICGEFTTQQNFPQGTHISDVGPTYTTIPDTQSTTNGPCPVPSTLLCSPTQTVNSNTPVCLTKCGQSFQLIQTFTSETRTYSYMLPIRFRKSKDIFCDCPNVNWICPDEAYIKDGFVFTGVFSTQAPTTCPSGTCSSTNSCSENCGLYINYEGALVDSQGNLIIPDQPYINEYYEYALKSRILENCLMDGDTTVQAQLQLAEARLKAARNNALTVVNTPDFAEMRAVHDLNRKAIYTRYYQPLDNTTWYDNYMLTNSYR